MYVLLKTEVTLNSQCYCMTVQLLSSYRLITNNVKDCYTKYNVSPNNDECVLDFKLNKSKFANMVCRSKFIFTTNSPMLNMFLLGSDFEA